MQLVVTFQLEIAEDLLAPQRRYSRNKAWFKLMHVSFVFYPWHIARNVFSNALGDGLRFANLQ